MNKHEIKALLAVVSKDKTRRGLRLPFGQDLDGRRYACATNGHVLVCVPCPEAPIGRFLLTKGGMIAQANADDFDGPPPDVSEVIPTGGLSGDLDMSRYKFAWTRKVPRCCGKVEGPKFGFSLDGTRAFVSKVAFAGEPADKEDRRPYVDAQLFGQACEAFEAYKAIVRLRLNGPLDPICMYRDDGPIAVVMPIRP